MLSQPQLNELAYWVTEKMNAIAHEVLYEGPIAETYRSLQLQHSVEGKPFVIQVYLCVCVVCVAVVKLSKNISMAKITCYMVRIYGFHIATCRSF